jgi:lipoprotein-anchoring transpeptidase ErfK/SrfK
VGFPFQSLPLVALSFNKLQVESVSIFISENANCKLHLPSMKIKKIISAAIALFILINTTSCQNETIKNIRKKLNYKSFIDRFKSKKNIVDASDTSNLFDRDDYDPSKMDSNDVRNTIGTMYESDSSLIKKIGADNTGILDKPVDSSTVTVTKDSFSSDIKKIATTEIQALKYNLDQLKKTTSKTDTAINRLRQKDCAVWADVSKKDQRLYLYVEGQCVDTFKVSSGDKNHTTPNFDRRPCGPQFQKYTSKKYPGGSYNGLGNMPYVLFVQGGYGLHGTTIGNIKKLGNPASHGCIRLHPDNAKIIFELVKAVGVENTWVTVRE